MGNKINQESFNYLAKYKKFKHLVNLYDNTKRNVSKRFFENVFIFEYFKNVFKKRKKKSINIFELFKKNIYHFQSNKNICFYKHIFLNIKKKYITKFIKIKKRKKKKKIDKIISKYDFFNFFQQLINIYIYRTNLNSNIILLYYMPKIEYKFKEDNLLLINTQNEKNNDFYLNNYNNLFGFLEKKKVLNLHKKSVNFLKFYIILRLMFKNNININKLSYNLLKHKYSTISLYMIIFNLLQKKISNKMIFNKRNIISLKKDIKVVKKIQKFQKNYKKDPTIRFKQKGLYKLYLQKINYFINNKNEYYFNIRQFNDLNNTKKYHFKNSQYDNIIYSFVLKISSFLNESKKKKLYFILDNILQNEEDYFYFLNLVENLHYKDKIIFLKSNILLFLFINLKKKVKKNKKLLNTYNNMKNTNDFSKINFYNMNIFFDRMDNLSNNIHKNDLLMFKILIQNEDYIIKKTINMLMLNGQKHISEKIFYKVLELIKFYFKKKGIFLFLICLIKFLPAVTINKSIIRDIHENEFPKLLTFKQSINFAIKEIIKYTRNQKTKYRIHLKLFLEIINHLMEFDNSLLIKSKKEFYQNLNYLKYNHHYRWFDKKVIK